MNYTKMLERLKCHDLMTREAWNDEKYIHISPKDPNIIMLVSAPIMRTFKSVIDKCECVYCQPGYSVKYAHTEEDLLATDWRLLEYRSKQ